MISAGLVQYSDVGLFLLRITIGAIFVYHAVPKLQNPKSMTGIFGGGRGAEGGVLLLGAVELICGILLAFGVFIQFAALLLAVVMIGAIYMKIVKWKVPFFATDKTGWEFDLILLAGNIAMILTNGGAISITPSLVF